MLIADDLEVSEAPQAAELQQQTAEDVRQAQHMQGQEGWVYTYRIA